MTYEQYWHGDPHLIYRYENAFIAKQKNKEQNMWLLGKYFACALNSTPISVHGFIEQGQLGEYPDMPFVEKREIPQKTRELIEQAKMRIAKLGYACN